MGVRVCALGAILATAALAAAGESPSLPEGWRIAATLVGHESVVKALAFSPDGSRLFSGSFDGEIKVWDVRTRRQLAAWNAKQKLCGLAVSPSGTTLASAVFVSGGRGEVKLWDAGTFQLRATLPCPRIVYSLAFSRDSELIAAAGDEEVCVGSVRDGRLKHKLAAGMFAVQGLAFSPDGRTLYGGGMLVDDKPPPYPGTLRAWDVASGTKLGEIGFPHPVSGIDLSADGTFLAVGAGFLHVLDIANADKRVRFTKRWFAVDERWDGVQTIMQEQFGHVAIDANRKLVAGAAGSPGSLTPEAGHVALFALQDGRRIAELQTPRPAKDRVEPGEYDIRAVAFSPDGKMLASGGQERVITLWTTGAKAGPSVVPPAGK
jgi:WD40 repeat protein